MFGPPAEAARGGRFGRVESVAGPVEITYLRSGVLVLDLRSARRNGPAVLVTRNPRTGEEFDGAMETSERRLRIAEARASAAEHAVGRRQMRDTVARLIGRNLLCRDLVADNGLSSGARS